MNIILFGPPGAGKGTQSKYLVNKLNAFQISTGDLLREEIKKNSDIGKSINDDMKNGKFISDDIVNKLIEKLISDPQKKNKLIFDGYPRSLSQAKNLEVLLKNSNQSIDLILFLISEFVTLFFNNLSIISSVAKSPLEIVSSISFPISVLFLISFLNKSPVDI